MVDTVSPETRNKMMKSIRSVSKLESMVSKDLCIEDNGYYLGEWHFHPYASSRMSLIDRRQMNEISANESIHCPEPILFIIGGDPIYVFLVNINLPHFH